MKFVAAYITAATLLWHAIAGCTCGARHVHADTPNHVSSSCSVNHDHHTHQAHHQELSNSPQFPAPCPLDECDECHCVELSNKTARYTSTEIDVDLAVGVLLIQPQAISYLVALQQDRSAIQVDVGPPSRADLSVSVLML